MFTHTDGPSQLTNVSRILAPTVELLGDPKGYSGMSKAVGVTCGIDLWYCISVAA